MDLDHFVTHQNIERYRKLSDIATDEPQRRVIFRLLAEELEKFKQLARDQGATPAEGT
jgi:hypothetical protein